ncbi:MAG TPA: ABC transporter ATP-binding protein, partial [Planctomycetota bacterium]|nr:ABC transporter ATP-binding protein [Planctomycetota bacterium]
RPMTGAEVMIATHQLGREFAGKWAVRGLDLAIRRGELYGFLGQNGAGKTTTLRMLTGLLRPSAGALRIAGLDPRRDGRAIKQLLAFVPDTPPLYDYLTGRQYVALVASLWRVDRKARDERSERLFPLLGLQESADELCKGYSHGTRKKLHIAAVLTTAPQVLLLDEPSSGLDPLSTRRLKDLLLEEVARGTTVMLSTHVLEIAEQICHRVGILANGSLRAEGTVPELRLRHGNRSFEDVFLSTTVTGPLPGTHDGTAAS